MVRFTPPGQPDQKFGSNSGTYFFVREHNKVFESMGGLRLTGFSVAAGGEDQARQMAPWRLDVSRTDGYVGSQSANRPVVSGAATMRGPS
jgi:hypothetical protein